MLQCWLYHYLIIFWHVLMPGFLLNNSNQICKNNIIFRKYLAFFMANMKCIKIYAEKWNTTQPIHRKCCPILWTESSKFHESIVSIKNIFLIRTWNMLHKSLQISAKCLSKNHLFWSKVTLIRSILSTTNVWFFLSFGCQKLNISWHKLVWVIQCYKWVATHQAKYGSENWSLSSIRLHIVRLV